MGISLWDWPISLWKWVALTINWPGRLRGLIVSIAILCHDSNWRSERSEHSHSQVIKMEICDIYIYLLYTTCDFLLITIAHARWYYSNLSAQICRQGDFANSLWSHPATRRRKGCGETYQERSVTDHCLHHRATGALNFNMALLLFTTVSVNYRVTMAIRSKSKEIQLR